jgi:hypothetical protein
LGGLGGIGGGFGVGFAGFTTTTPVLGEATCFVAEADAFALEATALATKIARFAVAAFDFAAAAADSAIATADFSFAGDEAAVAAHPAPRKIVPDSATAAAIVPTSRLGVALVVNMSRASHAAKTLLRPLPSLFTLIRAFGAVESQFTQSFSVFAP